jgi:hypothetical protein
MPNIRQGFHPLSLDDTTEGVYFTIPGDEKKEVAQTSSKNITLQNQEQTQHQQAMQTSEQDFHVHSQRNHKARTAV